MLKTGRMIGKRYTTTIKFEEVRTDNIEDGGVWREKTQQSNLRRSGMISPTKKGDWRVYKQQSSRRMKVGYHSGWKWLASKDNQTLGELKVERTDIIEDGGNWQVRYTYTTIKLEEEWTYIIEDKGDWQVRYTWQSNSRRQGQISLKKKLLTRDTSNQIQGGEDEYHRGWRWLASKVYIPAGAGKYITC